MPHKDQSTLLCSTGRHPSKYQGSVNTPIFKTSTFVYDSIEHFLQDDTPIHTDITYGRSGTQTTRALEEAICNLEQSKHCLLTPSGLSALIIAILSFSHAGSHILVPDTAYKCTKRFAEEELPKFGIDYSYYQATSVEHVESLIKNNTSLLLIESPGSGTFEVQDMPALCKLAKSRNIVTIADNSWASAILCNPFELGADITCMSLTKYFSGHSDVIMGSISTCNSEIYQRLKKTHLNFATIPSPEDVSIILRSIRTLHVRMQHHEISALKIASFLESHPKVQNVLHPALENCPTHHLWKRDFNGSAGVFSFSTISKDQNNVHHFIDSLKHFGIALSWGCYESLISPCNFSKIINADKRFSAGIYLRLNIGLERTEDLIQDLDAALEKLY